MRRTAWSLLLTTWMVVAGVACVVPAEGDEEPTGEDVASDDDSPSTDRHEEALFSLEGCYLDCVNRWDGCRRRCGRSTGCQDDCDTELGYCWDVCDLRSRFVL